MNSVAAAVQRAHPDLEPDKLAAIIDEVRREIYWELIRRALEWRESKDPGTAYREAEARACASIVHSVGAA